MIFFRPRVAVTLLAALFILALPASASAAFIVNSTADEPDAAAGGACESAAGKCTLRAAIEVTNAAAVADNILFDISLFDGQPADTIALTSPLPAVKAPVSINAGTCAPLPNPKPCAGVSGPSGNFGISVEADGVTISGLAITGSLTGINVINASEEFTARGNWIGVKLDGTAGANNTGIFIDPGSDRATIGGTEVVQRNVIAGNNNEGLDIQGASEAVILGNYFGVAPDGTTQMANAKNIEITDSTSGGGSEAVDNEIGLAVTGIPLTTMACDGGCNVISGAAASGIDLDGQNGANEAPASGHTVIRGNYVGLNAAGTAAVSNGTFAVLAGAADQVIIGGFGVGEMNRITGSSYGVYGENGDFLDVIGNVIGLDAGAGVASPPLGGIFTHSEAITEPDAAPYIVSNTVFASGIGIEQRFQGGMILDNFISGGNVGIQTLGSSPQGNLIADNRISNVGGNGILVENDGNGVFGNEIKEAGAAGILVKYAGTPPGISGSDGNEIGSDEEGRENEILLSGGPAIEIRNPEAGNNEIARNYGAGNAGPFIALVKAEPSEPNGPNEGIQPPVLSTARQASVSGTALPGATVRVFGKASPEEGELASFLGEVEADGSGAWKVSYASPVPVGTIVAATQTSSLGGTSELATATSIADPSKPGGGGGGGGGIACPHGNGGCPSPPVLQGPKPPNTKIVKGPAGKTTKTTAAFRFRSIGSNRGFQCKLDKGKFKKCRSPKTYRNLKPGKHVFKVRAVGPTGRVDPTPAKRGFTVLG